MIQYVDQCSPEEELSREICSQFVDVKLGRIGENAVRQEVLILLRLERELDQNYGLMLDHICDRLDICGEDIYSHLDTIADEVLTIGEVNWGRIVVLYVLAAKLTERCHCSRKDSLIDGVNNWLCSQVAKRSSWIRESGGWEGFVGQFSVPQPIISTSGWLHCFHAAAVTFGVLTTIFLIQNR